MSELGILNVGAGDTKLLFDSSKPEEVKRAARIVTAMMKSGFSILVEFDAFDADGKPIKAYRRVHEFDENTCEYIIVDEQEAGDGKAGKDQPGAARGRGRPPKVERRLPAGKHRGVAVGRSAGG